MESESKSCRHVPIRRTVPARLDAPSPPFNLQNAASPATAGFLLTTVMKKGFSWRLGSTELLGQWGNASSCRSLLPMWEWHARVGYGSSAMLCQA